MKNLLEFPAMMREIVLDTETTGLDPYKGDRLVEIGCLELLNQVPTGRTFQTYINPQRPMSVQASKITNLNDEFLANFEPFSKVAQSFLDFVGDARLIIHNATFDLKFLNFQLELEGFGNLNANEVIDTLILSRKKFPGSPASLDALCRRFKIDNRERVNHGALVDAKLLLEVYLAMFDFNQTALTFEVKSQERFFLAENKGERVVISPSASEMSSHQGILDKLKNPIYRAQNG